MRRWLVLAALVGVAAAPGPPDRHPRDPREAYTAADQAWAKRIALKRSDVPAGRRAVSQPSGDARRCRSLPDLSDLTLTGATKSPNFDGGDVAAGTEVRIFRTAPEAAAAFAREARPRLIRCYDELYRESGQSDLRFVSGGVVAASPVGERRFAIRVLWAVERRSARIYLRHLLWVRGRAVTALALASARIPPDDALELRIAKRLDARMR